MQNIDSFINIFSAFYPLEKRQFFTFVQAYNKYKERRLSRPRDDGTPLGRIYTEEKLHTIDNTLINTTVRDKYCSKNAELMETL